MIVSTCVWLEVFSVTSVGGSNAPRSAEPTGNGKGEEEEGQQTRERHWIYGDRR